MAFMNSINIIGSGLTAQQLRLDIVSENVTNSQTTRTENGGGAYRRKMVVFEEMGSRNTFRAALARAALSQKPVANSGTSPTAGGVRVAEIVEDEDNPMKMVYDPTHPDANEDGYVELPNVDMVMEIADAMAASRAYASNVTAFNTLKSVISSGLEIGR